MKKIADPILEISNLSKKEKNKTIDRLNLIVPSGDSLAVLYKNEANIELLCDILKGRKKPEKGKIFFKSTDITGIKNSFGVVEKKHDIPKTRSVIDFACMPIVKRGLSKKLTSVLVQKELDTFGLAEYGEKSASSLPKNLSLRAEIFSAYMCSHELMVIDEPFGDLNEEERAAELTLLENVKNDSGMSILIFTQNVELAAQFAASVMVVDDKTSSAGIIAVDKRNPDRTISKIKELYAEV